MCRRYSSAPARLEPPGAWQQEITLMHPHRNAYEAKS